MQRKNTFGTCAFTETMRPFLECNKTNCEKPNCPVSPRLLFCLTTTWSLATKSPSTFLTLSYPLTSLWLMAEGQLSNALVKPHPHLTHCDYGPIVLGELSQTLRTSDWVSKRVQGGHRARSTGLATPTSEANSGKSGKNGAPCQYFPFAQSHFIDIIQKWPCSLKEDSFQCPP